MSFWRTGEANGGIWTTLTLLLQLVSNQPMLNSTLAQKHTFTSYRLNFGPQHPAAHGVLRLVLQVNGEYILSSDPHIGLLHRGTEKLVESKRILQGLPYMDRLDYVSMMAQEHTYSLLFEKLESIQINESKIQYSRTILLEITRILNHLMSLTTHAMDVGALTPFLWAFEEREKLMEVYEKVSGARLHANFIRVGGAAQQFSNEVCDLLHIFCKQFSSRIDEIEDMLTSNRIWLKRLKGVGLLAAQKGLSWGFSGVMVRGSGLGWDLRKSQSYEKYDCLDFKIPTGLFGDCFDRYLVRMQEMRESLSIINQCLVYIRYSFRMASATNLQRVALKTGMESLIQHFKNASEDLVTACSDNTYEEYVSTEAPKGEFGLYAVVKDGQLYRLKIRAPGFFHLQGLGFMSVQHLLADVVTIIGSSDIVFGEVDR